ncbi:MAG: helix-turn-helix domain-containing protein [Steroidobacteraceae bacterium]
MDKRRKPLTPLEQLELRQEVERLIESHPEWTLPEALKQIRTKLHLTQPEMARVGRISKLTLQKIEAGASNPTIDTVQGLLRPFGLRLVIRRASSSNSDGA